MSTLTGFDLDGLRRAVQRCDRQYHLALFSDDAHVVIVDSAQPDAPTQVLHRKPAIGEWLEGLAPTAVLHEFRDAVARPGSVGYTEECCYADGSKVLLECNAEVHRGQIRHAVVTLVRVPRLESTPTEAGTAAHPTSQVPPSQAPARPRADRHLPGNFLG